MVNRAAAGTIAAGRRGRAPERWSHGYVRDRRSSRRGRATAQRERRCCARFPARPPDAASPAPQRPAGRWRAFVSALVIVVATILVPISIVSAWARVQLVDEEAFVATLAPLADDPAVQQLDHRRGDGCRQRPGRLQRADRERVQRHRPARPAAARAGRAPASAGPGRRRAREPRDGRRHEGRRIRCLRQRVVDRDARHAPRADGSRDLGRRRSRRHDGGRRRHPARHDRRAGQAEPPRPRHRGRAGDPHGRQSRDHRHGLGARDDPHDVRDRLGRRLLAADRDARAVRVRHPDRASPIHRGRRHGHRPGCGWSFPLPRLRDRIPGRRSGSRRARPLPRRPRGHLQRPHRLDGSERRHHRAPRRLHRRARLASRPLGTSRALTPVRAQHELLDASPARVARIRHGRVRSRPRPLQGAHPRHHHDRGGRVAVRPPPALARRCPAGDHRLLRGRLDPRAAAEAPGRACRAPRGRQRTPRGGGRPRRRAGGGRSRDRRGPGRGRSPVAGRRRRLRERIDGHGDPRRHGG